MSDLLASLWKNLPLTKSLQLRIMRLFQDEFLLGVTGVIFDSHKRILVVRHSYRGEWSLPGGYIKGKEHPKEGLAREIEEETGYIVQVTKLVRTRTDRETARLDFSLTGHLVGGEFTPSDEVVEASFFAFDDLPRLPQNQLLLIAAVMKKHTG